MNPIDIMRRIVEEKDKEQAEGEKLRETCRQALLDKDAPVSRSGLELLTTLGAVMAEAAAAITGEASQCEPTNAVRLLDGLMVTWAKHRVAADPRVFESVDPRVEEWFFAPLEDLKVV
jgi:hypothetical protein